MIFIISHVIRKLITAYEKSGLAVNQEIMRYLYIGEIQQDLTLIMTCLLKTQRAIHIQTLRQINMEF